MKTITARELELGDIVQLSDGEYMTATVKQIRDGIVTLFRPYTHTADFSYTGGVICYVGTEHISVMRDSDRTFELFRREKRPLK